MLNRFNNILLGIDVVAMFIVLMMQVFSRFIIFVPLPWSQDLITFLLVVSCFLGAGSATARGKQIRLEFFTGLLPDKAEDLVLIIADLISIAFLGVIFYQCLMLGIDNINFVIGASLVPSGYYYFAVCYGAAVMIINFTCLIGDRVKDMMNKRKGVEA